MPKLERDPDFFGRNSRYRGPVIKHFFMSESASAWEQAEAWWNTNEKNFTFKQFVVDGPNAWLVGGIDVMGENEPLTPAKVEAGIRHAMSRLQELVAAYAEAGDRKAITDGDFKIAWAQARTSYRDNAAKTGSKITDSILEDYATLHTSVEMRARLAAAATEESLKLALRATQSRLDAMRSLGANLRDVG